jgi:putative sterol carrier protein
MAALSTRVAKRPLRFVRARARQAFQAFVRRASDARLDRVAGSDLGLAATFIAMARAYELDKANGFAGELEFNLRRADGRVARWIVRIDSDGARTRRGRAAAPALTLTMSVADFVRIAARDLDPDRALLTGRLDLAGDFSLAQRLGDMFGRPAAL